MRPNIIVILVDDQGYGDLSCHGHPWGRTPGIDRFAAESVRLTDFHAYPMCTPTRGSLMTGLSAMRHQATNVSSGRTMLRTDVSTLPELLRDAGYRTGLFGKWHLGDAYPYRPQDRGFDRAVWFPSSHVNSVPDRWRNDYFDTWLRSEDGDAHSYEGYCTDILFRLTREWITATREGVAPGDDVRPFFAYLSLNALHAPLLVEEKYRTPYAEHGRHLATYWGMIANLDQNVARLDAWLADEGLADDTLVMYLSDNGGSWRTTSVYNAGMRGSKTDLWDGGHRVPAFVRWPHGAVGGPGRGRTVDDLVMIEDLMPTMMEWCGVPLHNLQLDGTSIASRLDGRAQGGEDRTAVLQYSRMTRPEPQHGDGVVLRGPWRYFPASATLNHVGDDPGQERNVALAHQDVAAELHGRYEQWWSGLDHERAHLCRVVIGAEEQPETLLSSCEWRDVFLDQQFRILEGQHRNGAWYVTVARSGRYRFALRRWPAESGLALRAPAPAHQGGDCVFPAGVALPIARARLRIGGMDLSSDTTAEDTAATFDVDLHHGPTTIRSWFYGDGEQELCGAYYLYASLLRPAA